ncbi:MAG: thiamine phosphate synthase [bacterium JZ-2024 1]
MGGKIAGIYLVMDDRYFHPALFFRLMEEIFATGVEVFQFRLKHGDPYQRFRWAKTLRRMAKDTRTLFIVNDYPALAADCDADGVHLGSTDIPLHIARKILGEDKIIGVSIGGDWEKGKKYEEQGANYVAMGAVFRSPTKPHRPVIGITPIQQAKSILHIPVVAIGGITPSNAPRILKAGADALAVISSVFSHPYPVQVVKKFRKIWESFKAETETAPAGSREPMVPSR